MTDIFALSMTAASIGTLHTLFGPDHYLPFVAMSRAGGWSMRKTLWITILSGIGHVGSSILFGAIGIALGLGITGLESLENSRGSYAAWALIAFGAIYLAWGTSKALRRRSHEHNHCHDGVEHTHLHTHNGTHTHIHGSTPHKVSWKSPWALFAIFVLGPCEPLIPILMYPAAKHNLAGVFLVSGIFSFFTLLTMTTVVFFAIKGVGSLPLGRFERWSHAMAGFTLLACGLSIEFLGL